MIRNRDCFTGYGTDDATACSCASCLRVAPPEPTADIKLVRRVGRVCVVRAQEPGELPVWTIHVDGDRPIYVALDRTDAYRVAAVWAV